MWDRDEMRREGACEVGGKWDATWEASRQPSVFMLTRRAAVFAAMRPTHPSSPLEAHFRKPAHDSSNADKEIYTLAVSNLDEWQWKNPGAYSLFNTITFARK